MKTIILLACLLSGCITMESPIAQRDYDQLRNSLHIYIENQDIMRDKTKERFQQLEYFLKHDECFIEYGVCLGERKKGDKLCWKAHEACVVRVYQEWMKLKGK